AACHHHAKDEDKEQRLQEGLQNQGNNIAARHMHVSSQHGGESFPVHVSSGQQLAISRWPLPLRLWLIVCRLINYSITNYSITKFLLSEAPAGVMEKQVFQTRFGNMDIAQVHSFRSGSRYDQGHERPSTIGVDVRALSLQFDLAHAGQLLQP